MIGYILLAFVGLFAYLYLWGLKRKNYWADKGVPYVESPIFLGNLAGALFCRENVTKALNRIYYHPTSKSVPFIGFNLFHKPAILLRDPDLVKQIMVKDFSDFTSRHSSGDISVDPIGAHNLFQLKNPTWKPMRQKLTPVFTSGKMKQWFNLVDLVGNNLNKRVKKLVEADVEMEIRQLAGFYTLDGISLVALATETNSLDAENPTDFYRMISSTWTESFFRKLSINTIFFLSDLVKPLKIKTFSDSFDNTIRKLFHEVYDQRVQSGQSRGDLIDALIAVKKEEDKDKESSIKIFCFCWKCLLIILIFLVLKDDALVGQAAVFLFAGFETSSHVISATLYCLAKNVSLGAVQKICNGGGELPN